MKNLLYSLVFLFLASCAANSPKPQWITDFRNDPDYYEVLTVVRTNLPGYHQIAREHATRDIAMQISTSIESEINLSESEAFGIARNEYLSSIRSSTRARLDNLSPVRSYEDKRNYWVWYRLGKSEYQAQRTRDRDAAMSRAADLLAEYEAMALNPAAGIPLLISALDQIADYLDMNLSYQGLDLGSEIIRALHALPGKIYCTWDEPETLAIARSAEPTRVSGNVTVHPSGNKVSGIPLCFRSESIDGISDTIFSDETGTFSLDIMRLDSLPEQQYIDLYFDRNHYDGLLSNPAALQIWHSIYFVPQRLSIKISRPKICLEYAYISGYQSGLRESVAGYLANLNLDLATKIENAQYLLQVRIFSKKGKYLDSLDYYSSFADIHLTLLDAQSGKTVNYIEHMGLKSGGNSRENAERNAERDAVKAIGDGLLYRLLYDVLLD